MSTNPTPPITVLLADPSDLTRLGFRTLLQVGARFTVVAEADTDTVAAAQRLQPDLIILAPATRNGFDARVVGELRRVSPSSRLVILTSVFDLNGFRAVVRGDVHGYFLKDFAARGEWLLGALLLIAEASAVIVAPSITGRREFLSNTAVEVRAPGPEVKRLSERELHVLALLLQGRSDQEVATELSIALGTVETHVHNISLKLGARSRIHLGLLASRAGLP